MFRKTIISTLTLAVLAGTTAALTTTGASAGGYGNGGHNGGYQKPYRHTNNWKRHVAWCHDRYNSYRAWDNSYQPYGGPRQICYSPYFRG